MVFLAFALSSSLISGCYAAERPLKQPDSLLGALFGAVGEGWVYRSAAALLQPGAVTCTTFRAAFDIYPALPGRRAESTGIGSTICPPTPQNTAALGNTTDSAFASQTLDTCKRRH
jgi:hypothetical protein